MSNNVILFPKENKNIKRIISIDEINQNVEMMNLYHIQETVNSLVPLIFAQLEVGGFSVSDIEEDEAILEGAFIVEALRSFLCKHYGIYHPFQRVVENIFEPDPSEKGTLRIVDILKETDLREDEEEE